MVYSQNRSIINETVQIAVDCCLIERRHILAPQIEDLANTQRTIFLLYRFENGQPLRRLACHRRFLHHHCLLISHVLS